MLRFVLHAGEEGVTNPSSRTHQRSIYNTKKKQSAYVIRTRGIWSSRVSTQSILSIHSLSCAASLDHRPEYLDLFCYVLVDCIEVWC